MKKVPRILKPWVPKSVGRKRQINAIPSVFDYETMLYIGANPRRLELIDLFFVHEYAIDVLEVWEKNFDDLVKWNEKWKIFQDLYYGDVRMIDEVAFFVHEGKIQKWDIILFWHGPEHLPRLDVAPALAKLEKHANHLVIVGCPRGEYKQAPVDGNPFERHESYLYEKDFQDIGYLTNTLRPHKTRGSNIVAWKKINGK